MKPFLCLAGIALAGVAAWQQPSPPQGTAGDVTVIEVTAKKYEFSPEEVRVKNGAKVQLKVRALDRDHGIEFTVRPEGAPKDGAAGLVFAAGTTKWKLVKEKETLIEFTAGQAGTYPFKCAVFCGFGHRGMKGRIVVEE